MNENNNIINYESIFEDENNDKSHDIKKSSNIPIINIIIYTLLMFVGLGSLFVGLLFKKSSNTYLLLERQNISSDSALVITLENEYLKEKDNFENLSYINYEEYVIVYKNSLNDEYKDYLLKDNILSNIISGKQVNWPLLEGNDNEEQMLILYHFNSKLGSELLKIDNNSYYALFSNYKNDYSLLINVLTYLLLLIPLFILNKRRIFRDFDLLIKDKENPIVGNLLSSFIMVLALTIALGFIVTILSNMFGINQSNSINQLELEAMFKSKYFILMILMTVVAAPIVEEVIFRYSIFKVINNEKIAFHASAIIFGLIHLSTELQLLFIKGVSLESILSVIFVSVNYVGMGYLFSYFYKKNNKNLTFLILVHALNNLFASISIFL